ncbi:helix-turn-helix domain-containing protein [Flavobacterium sp. 3-218]
MNTRITTCAHIRKALKSYSLLLCIIFTATTVFAQKKSSFDSVMYYTAVDLASKDIKKALQTADSLYEHSVEPIHKVKSLMLIADLQKNTGDLEKSIDHAVTAENIAEINKLYEWQVRIAGFLSAQYRTLGLKEQSVLSLKKVLKIIPKIDNPKISNQLQAITNQQIAKYAIEDEDFNQAISYLKITKIYLDKTRNSKVKFFHYATNEYMFGQAYLGLKDYSKSLYYYNSSLSLLFKNDIAKEGTILSGFVYSDIGEIYFALNDLKNASFYYNKALLVAEQSDFLELKEEVYYNLAVYYDSKQDVKNYARFSKLYEKTQLRLMDSHKEGVNSIVNRLQNKEAKLSQMQGIIIASSVVIAILLITGIVLIIRRRKSDIRKFEEIISKIESSSFKPEYKEEKSVAEEVEKKVLMTEETEQLILKKLKKFEEKDGYINRNISLSSLSAKFEINSKYLSYVINKHKGKDFNNYINALRIYYIIRKMESDPVYLSYKISYLAEECGFSSHSKFTAIFKAEMGISPSVFMQYAAEKNNKMKA